uniref:hypothetical protein n=1 Tax=Flavobacterium sp. TaxID=239 RepID=UPI00404AD58B
MKKLTLILFSILLVSCENNFYSDIPETATILNLKWNKAYTDDTIDKSLIGLKWALSYIGASLPSSDEGFVISNETIIIIDFKKLGFSRNAQNKLTTLYSKIILSEEYNQTNAIDLGRFVSLIIGSSEFYYETIGVPKTLNQVLNKYTFLPQKGYVNNSGVSLEHRIIQFSEQDGFNQLFFCKEIDPITQEVYEYETIELLSNGQLRFGIFDANGNRKPNADSAHSNAGKPAKCMWCHESNINQMFSVQNDFTGYLTYNDFQNTLINYRESNKTQKLALPNGVDFSQTQEHTFTELLYISFMEPSAERLSLEWDMTVLEVQNLLVSYPTHTYSEFPFLGNLYDRNQIENISPHKGLQVSTSVREESTVEVNHLQ